MIELLIILTSFLSGCLGFIAFNKFIYPRIVKNNFVEIERNPKWIMSELNYYGFDDIDIIVSENKFYSLPYFKLGKDNRIELWIPSDISSKDALEVGRLALAGKITIKYGLEFPNKPIDWLSTLCYMLDGNNVCTYSKKDNKPID